MSNLVISRPPQFLDPWFVEIEQVWDEIEAANNDNDSRITTLEGLVIGGTGVVTSVSKSGSTQLTGDVTFTGTGSVTLNQVGQNIEVAGTGVTDHGALTGLLDDDHTQYILVNGSRAFSGNQSFGNFQATNFRVENLGILPAPGNQGRLVFDTTSLSLKVDNGTSFVSAGVTDHGLLTGLGDDDHLQYLLTDGTRACTGDFTVNGIYKNEANEPFTIESQDDDSASAVGTIIDTFNDFTIAGAKLVSIRNQGVEKAYIDKDGVISGTFTGNLSSLTSLYALIDTDNDGTTEVFSIEANSPTPSGGQVLLQVNESGEAQIFDSLRIGSLGVPSDTLDVDGTANISGDVLFGGALRSNTNFTIQVDANNDESAVFEIQDGTASPILQITEAGDGYITSSLRVGGASVATNTFEVDGDSDFNGLITLAGATRRIRSPQNLEFQVDYDNNGTNSFLWFAGDNTQIMSLDESGNLTVAGTILGGSSPFRFESKTAANEGAYASATITVINNTLDSGDSISITDTTPTVFTFVEGVDFVAGVDTTATALNLASAINSAALLDVTAVPVGPVITLTSDLPGAAYNAIALSESDAPTDNFTLSGATFSGGTDVAPVTYVLDTTNNITLAGSKLLSLRNQGVEKFAIDKDGIIVTGGGLTSADSVAAYIDNDNNSSAQTFTIYHDVTSPTGGKELLQVRENGEVEIYGGPLIGGSSPFIIKSKEPNGASAVAFELNTVNTLSTSGAKLLSLKNNGTEVFAIDKDGKVTGAEDFVYVVSPSEGGAGIQAALTAVNTAGGGIVQLRAGTYAVSSAIVWPSGCSNVSLRGVGHATVLNSTINDNTSYVFDMLNSSTANPQNKAISNTTRGNTSITCTTVADGALFLANMPIFIQGTDPDGKVWMEENEVLANGSGITGIVTLKSKITRTLTSASIVIAFANGLNNSIRDLKIVHSSGISHAIRAHAQHGLTIDSCFFDGSSFSGGYGIHIKAFNSIINNNKIWNYNVAGGDIAGIGNMVTGYGLRITKNEIINCGAVGESGRCGFSLGDNSSPALSDALFENNIVLNSQGIGVNLRGSGPVRGIRILGNLIRNSETDGFNATSDNTELVISDNICSYNGISTGSGISISSATYLTIDNNITEYNKDEGIRASSCDRLTVSDNFVRKNTDEGMYFPTCTHLTITGNTVVDNTVDSGIYLQNCTDAVVSSNNLDANKTGIKLVNTCVDITISGNTSRGNITSALEISNTSSNVLVTGNNFRGQTISLGTGANIISANNME